MKKAFKTSPLPFRGQKRYYIKRFASVLARCEDITTVVDLFGGSGLLSRVAKDQLPNARVIYNDFDRFDKRVANIDRTNALCAQIAPLVAGVADNKRIPDEIKQQCLQLMRESEKTGAVDYITLSASLLFSGNWATSYDQFAKQTFYNRAVNSHYDATGYFDGLEITHKDYRELFDEFKDLQNVLFILDPPYLQTECSAYKSDTYWQLKDYLDVLNMLKGTKYVFFTSGKSQIIDLCKWINQNFPNAELLKGAELWEQNSRVNDFNSYKDIMIAKVTA
ncbi:MAG: DNA adenine methylase [Bacteroides sp.]|nr:DNA adenine methylase [Bacteroides sp.]MCM1380024.1 DNA adenine methylase [Bacteroides sp.]MCM1446381.1 DNA adenine methylase [Prevotella sp.]